MGQYERAVEALLAAEPRLDRDTEPRLWYKLHANLSVLYCHLGRYREAAALVEDCRGIAVELGDEIDVVRMTWVDGRIAGGLGRTEEARALLSQARRQLTARKMWYDVALALLEEAALLLDEGWTAEVKVLAGHLQEVFASQGIHLEALAALRLFHEAVEREEATAALARRLLAFLFRARYDPGLELADL